MKVDQANGIVFVAVSALVCWGAARLPYGNLHNPGPGFMPFWSGIVLGLLSMGLLLKSTFGSRESESIRQLLAAKIRLGKVLFVLAALALYALLLDYLGFLLVTFLLLGCLIRFVDPQPWRKVMGWALFGAIGSYLVFEVWMKLRLPRGVLGV